MTFGEKLKALRKERGYSQEEFAQHMDVSRQAVSKWESDRGTPETDKLLQISTIFGVTLDYLLKSEHSEDGQQNNGYYVSREMIDGFLSYKRQGAKRITIGVCLIILSNLFVSLFDFNQIGTALYFIITILGIAILIWNFFQPKRYDEMGKKQLLFDDVTIKEFREKYEKNRKRYGLMIIAGVALLIISPMALMYDIDRLDFSIISAFTWVSSAASASLFILAGLALHAENVIAKNTEYMSKKSKKSKYTWVYISLPVTAIAVIIGIFTNAWSPVAPVIALFCILLIIVCKLLMEGRGSND